MVMIANKRPVMTLNSSSSGLICHYARIVLAEKGVPYDLIKIDPSNKARLEELLELNPYGTLPVLLDRDLVLYDINIITEYLDERFPHPPLMPVYPVARAKARMIMYRFHQDWMPLVRKLDSGKQPEIKAAAKDLANYLIHLTPLFNSNNYFLGDEFSLVDCCMAPLLWRLPTWGITFSPSETKAINKYSNLLFKRDSFQISMTETELEMRKLGREEVVA